jgi:hypothetical protein
MTVSPRQPFRRGYVSALLGRANNQSTISASLMLDPGGAASSRVLGTQVLRDQRAGTVKVVIRPRTARALKRLLLARQIWLRVRVSAPGAPPYSANKRIANRR